MQNLAQPVCAVGLRAYASHMGARKNRSCSAVNILRPCLIWTKYGPYMGVPWALPPLCPENKHSTWRQEFLGCGSENLEQSTHLTAAAWQLIRTV